MNKNIDDFLDLLDPTYLQEYMHRKACQAPIEELGPGRICGEEDCGGAPRFNNLSKDDILALRAKEDVAQTLLILAKGIFFASKKLNIDMGDGEPTYQCCNAVCGHCNCLVGNAVEVAQRFCFLSEQDKKQLQIDIEDWMPQPSLSTSMFLQIKETGDSLPKPHGICFMPYENGICLEWWLGNSEDSKITFFWDPVEGASAIFSSQNGSQDVQGDQTMIKVKEWFQSQKNNKG